MSDRIVRARSAVLLLLAVATICAPVLAQAPAAGAAGAAAPAGAPTENPVEIQEPTRDELRAAYAARVAAVNAGAVKVMSAADAGALHLELQDLQKLLCTRIEREGTHFDCRVEVRVQIAEQRARTSVVNLWLEHDGKGWVAR